MHRTIKRLLFATGLFVLSTILGTIGFMRVENYSFIDGLYMSVITFSTVGFSEVSPLSDNGKIFSIIYITLNLGILAYTVSVISTIIFEGELNTLYKKYITTREVKKLNNHVILCGFGNNGEKAAEELYVGETPFVIIESDKSIIESQLENSKYNFILGNATLDETLIDAGLEKADTLITTLPSDADNVFITLTAKENNPNIKVIARASEASSERKLLRAGASHVVMPERLGGMHMANLVTKPAVIEFLELLNGVGTEKLELLEINHDNLKTKYQQRTLKELDIKNHSGATIIAYKDDREGFIFNSNYEKVISQGDILIVLGSQNNLKQFKTHFLSN
ncbi:MAG: potassium channel protein [Fulvivirga sp.]